MFVPTDKNVFYSEIVKSNISLSQGDILDAKTLGLKIENDSYSPDYWMIITKSCDLVLNCDSLIVRKKNISIVPLIAIKIIYKILKRDFTKDISNVSSKIVLIAVHNLFSIFLNHNKKGEIDNLIKDRVSKFMFLPPDGVILKEPMLIDFDIVSQINGNEQSEVKKVLQAKVLQVNSPFREKVARRFAMHYSSIGVLDDEIREEKYVNNLKKSFSI